MKRLGTLSPLLPPLSRRFLFVFAGAKYTLQKILLIENIVIKSERTSTGYHQGVYTMKLKNSPYLLHLGTNKPLYRADPSTYERIMSKWAALPSTIRGQVCQALRSPYPLWARGDEKGFGFWTMHKAGSWLAFHVGNPSPIRNMLLTVKIGNEDDCDSCYWNHEKPNVQNYRDLRENLIRTAFETMACSGPKRREEIHSIVNEIYPLS